MRIYPADLQPVALEPMAGDFRVVDVDEQRGQGVLVLRKYLEGDVLFRMNGHLGSEITQYTLQMGPNLHLDDPYFAGKVLHSCEPNSRLDVDTRLFIAVRDIEPNTLLTMDYEETEDVLFRAFECACGALTCRGEIVGRSVVRTPQLVSA